MDENLTVPDWIVRHVGTISLQAAAQIESLRLKIIEKDNQLTEANHQIQRLSAQ